MTRRRKNKRPKKSLGAAAPNPSEARGSEPKTSTDESAADADADTDTDTDAAPENTKHTPMKNLASVPPSVVISFEPETIPTTAGPSSERENDDGMSTEDTSVMESDDDAPDQFGSSPASRVAGPRQSDAMSVYRGSRYIPQTSASHRKLALIDDGVDDTSIDIAASTRSLLEQVLDYNEENGRRYCGDYFMPNDEDEQTRQYLLNQVFLHVLSGKPTTVPLHNPAHVLDIGTGTGDWAIHMGELYPDCEVVGIDISAIQPNAPPHNVFFEIEDAELTWLRNPASVDLVHLRHMAGCFRDWPFVFDQAYDCLKPGAWLEIQEFDDASNWASWVPEFPPDSPIHAIARDLELASKAAGRPRTIAHLDPKMWHGAGFVEIHSTEVDIPITLEAGSAGKIWLVAFVDGFESTCLRLLTKYMGWDPEHTKQCCEEVAMAIVQMAKNPAKVNKLTTKIRVTTGRKPSNARSRSRQSAIRYELQGAEDALDDTPSEVSTTATVQAIRIRGAASEYLDLDPEHDRKGKGLALSPRDALGDLEIDEPMVVDTLDDVSLPHLSRGLRPTAASTVGVEVVMADTGPTPTEARNGL